MYKERWREVITQTNFMRKYVCITTIVRHIIEESAKIMKNTKHENDWYFYHDALSLMTSSHTKDWMEKEGIYHRWLLPKNGLNKGTPYEKYPTGNSPELMPLDTTLFQDILVSLKRHIVYTQKLPKDDMKKFSIDTVDNGTRAFIRLIESYPGAPLPYRIVQDVDKTVESMKTILENKGTVVQGLGNKGDRFIRSRKNWGGKRTKGEGNGVCDRWVHPDAVVARRDFMNSVGDYYEDSIANAVLV